jgi:hypothetical protein
MKGHHEVNYLDSIYYTRFVSCFLCNALPLRRPRTDTRAETIRCASRMDGKQRSIEPA